MDTLRELGYALHNGIEFSAADITALNLATINTTIANYAYLRQVPGPIKRAVITFGREDSTRTTKNEYSLPVTDDGSTGSAFLKLFTAPVGRIKILSVVANLTVISTAAWAPTSPVISIGTAAAGSNQTLTSTEADILPSTALTISGGSSTFNASYYATANVLTDSSGGTASTTIAAIGGTYTQSEVRNAVASLAAAIAPNAGSKELVYDGSSTAWSPYLNFACNSDPSTGKTLKFRGSILFDYIRLGTV